MNKTPTGKTQADLETLFSKHQLLPVLRDEFKEILTIYDNSIKEFYADMLSQICLHRQANVLTMVGILSPKHGSPQEIADKLVTACELDLIDYNVEYEKFILKYDISDDIKAMLGLVPSIPSEC